MELTRAYTENKGLIYLRDDPRARAEKGGKPVISFEGSEISCANSAWVTKTFSDGSKNEYRTEFILYRSDTKYYLNILGKSKNEHDQTFSKVIEFYTPQQCMDIVNDPEDKRLYLSEPVVALVLEAAKSPMLPQKERETWLALLTQKGE